MYTVSTSGRLVDQNIFRKKNYIFKFFDTNKDLLPRGLIFLLRTDFSFYKFFSAKISSQFTT